MFVLFLLSINFEILAYFNHVLKLCSFSLLKSNANTFITYLIITVYNFI